MLTSTGPVAAAGADARAVLGARDSLLAAGAVAAGAVAAGAAVAGAAVAGAAAGADMPTVTKGVISAIVLAETPAFERSATAA